jgi:hypothetical protein
MRLVGHASIASGRAPPLPRGGDFAGDRAARHDARLVPRLLRSMLWLLLSGCAYASPPPAAPPPAPPPVEDGSAAVAPPPAPAPPTLPACDAKHPLPELPLSSISVDSWADELGRYQPMANGGRPTPLDEARVEVEAYLKRVGACAERLFAGSFLPSLQGLPADHALSDPTLATTVELVIDETGALASKGVVSSSGVPEFDAAVVATFAGVFPLGELSPALLSSDGRLYVTWEVRRDPEKLKDLTLARAWKLRF